jgi:hypothetical protein
MAEPVAQRIDAHMDAAGSKHFRRVLESAQQRGRLHHPRPKIWCSPRRISKTVTAGRVHGPDSQRPCLDLLGTIWGFDGLIPSCRGCPYHLTGRSLQASCLPRSRRKCRSIGTCSLSGTCSSRKDCFLPVKARNVHGHSGASRELSHVAATLAMVPVR